MIVRLKVLFRHQSIRPEITPNVGRRLRSTMSGLKFIDIGVNLTDEMYQGVYHEKTKHQPDLDAVLERSWEHGLQKMIITGGSLGDAQKAIAAAAKDDRLFATVGCHPTRCLEFKENDQEYLENLYNLISENKSKVVAVGEFGLDYDRLQFCPREEQKKYFELQLELAERTGLPMFLHCRNAAQDLQKMLGQHESKIKAGGVVHSFDGSLEECQKFLEMGFHIGINGCSLKTEENLDVVREIPLDKLMIETDAPWCEIRPSHSSFKHVKFKFDPSEVVKRERWKPGCVVKNRNEPCFIRQVLEVICAVKEEPDIQQVATKIYNNTLEMFFSNSVVKLDLKFCSFSSY